MKFKDLVENIATGENNIDCNEFEGSMMELSIGVSETQTMYSYLCDVITKKGSEPVLMAKLMDGEATDGLVSMMNDAVMVEEMADKWPILYGMLQAGCRDVYTDAAVILLEGTVFVAVKFDVNRFDKADGGDYFTDKLAHLVDQYQQITTEIEENDLDRSRIAFKKVVGVAQEGWKAFRIAKMIGKLIEWLP